ncbi:protein painting of fourth isoform X1 [Drosophila gunungcola]|uniref:protein painting of fourth isoform X1 n=1 Tax=Drosophila gunungcola TaxID=103775 RepID=UPI0022E31578|nr:protein painting of fourth isoform X1 [Drosophila gunungcola]
MDSKRAALEAGDGPVSKRLNSTEDQGRIIGVMEPSPGDGNQLILGKHVAPYTANGCTPPPEAYLFETTPAGSQLLPWNSAADGPTSDNDAELENSTTDNKKPDTAKMSRRELAKLRRENTLRALALERELTNKSTATVALLIRFPDPDISAPMLAGISREIQDVVLPASVAPRHCLVHLRVGADVEATIREINRVRFGTGYLEAEVKPFTDEEQAEFIDPCSLYVGNIPFNMTTSAIKAYFINAVRVDIRALKREKRARYAFVRYASPDHTIEAFRELVNCPLNSRTLTVRYRRLRKHAGLPTVQCTSFYHRMPSPNGGDDDNADCKVITPPPVESIIISDSDNCSDSSGGGKGRSKRKDKDKMNDQEKEIQKLKRQMAEYGAIIKNLQVQQNILGDSLISDLTPKIESCGNPSACIIGSNAVHLMRDIKTECAYLGIPENGTAVQESAGKPTAHSLDENRKKAKTTRFCCFGWMFSGPSRRRKSAKLTSGKYETLRTSPEKDDRLEELYAQLECDPDP